MNATADHPGGTDNSSNATLSADGGSSVAKFHPVIVVCLASSLVCLLLLAVVYRLLAEFRNLPGRILMSLSGSLAVTYVFLVLDLIFRKKFSTVACVSVGFVIHVTFLATFFWTNVMAYDVWRTLSSKAHERVRSGRKRYFCYSAYAWGATLAVSLPALVFDNTDLIPVYYRPKMGVKRCWLSGTPAFLLYFNSPVGLVLLANLLFFLVTVRTLLKIGKTTVILRVNKDKKRFYLYVKLFLIMGLIWIAEFVPWISGIYKLYAVAGILNSLHGVYLFLVFVCKRSVFRSLRQLHPSAGHRSAKSWPQTQESSVKSGSSVFYCSGADKVNVAPE